LPGRQEVTTKGCADANANINFAAQPMYPFFIAGMLQLSLAAILYKSWEKQGGGANQF